MAQAHQAPAGFFSLFVPLFPCIFASNQNIPICFAVCWKEKTVSPFKLPQLKLMVIASIDIRYGGGRKEPLEVWLQRKVGGKAGLSHDFAKIPSFP
jgi:hypothetical protein